MLGSGNRLLDLDLWYHIVSRAGHERYVYLGTVILNWLLRCIGGYGARVRVEW